MKVWVFVLVFECEIEVDENVLKCLVMLSDYFGLVNCVWFLWNGWYLVSGSTDTSVLVYVL